MANSILPLRQVDNPPQSSEQPSKTILIPIPIQSTNYDGGSLRHVQLARGDAVVRSCGSGGGGAMCSLEVEPTHSMSSSSSTASSSWKGRVLPWFQAAVPPPPPRSHDNMMYYTMNDMDNTVRKQGSRSHCSTSQQQQHQEQSSSQPQQPQSSQPQTPQTPPYIDATVPLHPQSSFQRVASWIRGTHSTSKHSNTNNDYYGTDSEWSDEESIRHFDDWTPPDSSYGAAIPVGGWIPKHIRRNIEATLICLGIVLLVYLVVTASMFADARSHSHSNHNSSSNTDNDSTNDNGDTANNNNGNNATAYGGDSGDDYYSSGGGNGNNYNGGVELDDDRYVEYGKYGTDDYYRDDDRKNGDDDNNDDANDSQDDDEDDDNDDANGGDDDDDDGNNN